ncbi:hypothetical protein KUTeg_021236 [Tegillarca granosa]|uniref:Uncharacterized protein n=1 Tax=Tegillarca granosa TaxID=220873 RepID=A0ABQ9ECJ4_TEGGR|nr:hypothetical protein KUTeg_021236 [Tegillarca granosa]
MKCIQRLKTDCPRQIATIDQALTNLEGAQEELSELCSDDKIYEVYAMHLTCFYNEGSYSERCFRTHMNTSKNLLSHLDEQPLEMLCRNLLKTLECIQSNIAQKCGSEAGDLVPKLVKPMVRRSTHCTQYSVITTTQKPSATRGPRQGANTNNQINRKTEEYEYNLNKKY